MHAFFIKSSLLFFWSVFFFPPVQNASDAGLGTRGLGQSRNSTVAVDVRGLGVGGERGGFVDRKRKGWHRERPTPTAPCVALETPGEHVRSVAVLDSVNSRKHLCFLVFKGCCSGHSLSL